jgi:hypothetical protein
MAITPRWCRRVSAWSQIAITVRCTTQSQSDDSRRYALPAPLRQHLFHFVRDLVACVGAVYTADKQLIVRGVVVVRHSRLDMNRSGL